MSSLILIIDDNGYRLCRDGRWRDFANFGTMSSCVKTYKRLSAAKKMAHRVWGRVVVVPSDETVERCVEAGGMVVQQRPSVRTGYVVTTHASLNDFVVGV